MARYGGMKGPIGAVATSNEQLLRIVFTCNISTSLSPTALESLHNHQAKLGADCDLTGLLLREGGRLCGLVEGSEEQVLGCVERIATDRRHRCLHVLREDRIAHRQFANWSFCAVPESSQEPDTGKLPASFVVILSQKL